MRPGRLLLDGFGPYRQPGGEFPLLLFQLGGQVAALFMRRAECLHSGRGPTPPLIDLAKPCLARESLMRCGG